VLAETDVVDRASSSGEGVGFASLGAEMGLISGVLTGGEEALEAEPLLDEAALLPLPLPLAILPAACFVTAAVIPPFSLAFFLSFLLGIQMVFGRRREQVSCPRERV
jgi:hypothetical protein